jgi:hypothetical protein
MRRRRRILAALTALAGLGFVLAAAGALPWVGQLLLDLLLVGYVVHLRRIARAGGMAGVPGAARVPNEVRPGRVSADRPAWSIPQRPSRQTAYRRPAEPRRPPAAATTSPIPTVVDPPLSAEPMEETWAPVPVPPPSYVASAAVPDDEPVAVPDPAPGTEDPTAARASAEAAEPAAGRRQRGLLDELGLWDDDADDAVDPVDRLSRRRAVGED